MYRLSPANDRIQKEQRKARKEALAEIIEDIGDILCVIILVAGAIFIIKLIPEAVALLISPLPY